MGLCDGFGFKVTRLGGLMPMLLGMDMVWLDINFNCFTIKIF